VWQHKKSVIKIKSFIKDKRAHGRMGCIGVGLSLFFSQHRCEAMTTFIQTKSLMQINCKDCSLSSLCLPLSLDFADMEQLDSIVKRAKPLKKGEFLFHQGDAFASVFAVRSGSLKTFSINDDGSEQLTGFYLPSELVGLSGLHNERHPVCAQALETTSLCELPFAHLDELTATLPGLRHQLLRVMSREIQGDEQMMWLLSKKTADARIASFLLNLSTRFRVRGYSGSQFRLAMSRREMGNYLGLAVETVSRVFTRFVQSGWLSAEGKEVRILDAQMLEGCAAGRLNPAD